MPPIASPAELPDLQSRPALPQRVTLRSDPVTGEPVLLYPEGLLVLNATAHEIVMRCDGKTTVHSLLNMLAQEYDADENQLRSEVLACLHGLNQRQLLEFRP
jgi:pyrroloquinoline quinone biosynthesis protein D